MTQLLITHVPYVTANNTMSFLQLHHWYMVLLESLKSCHVITALICTTSTAYLSSYTSKMDNVILEYQRWPYAEQQLAWSEMCTLKPAKAIDWNCWAWEFPDTMIDVSSLSVSAEYLFMEFRAVFCKIDVSYVLKEPKKIFLYYRIRNVNIGTQKGCC